MIHFFNNIPIKFKLMLAIGAFVAGMLFVAGIVLLPEKNIMLADRNLKTRHVVETAFGILTYHHDLQKKGRLSEEEAQIAALNLIRTLRYEKNEYFWINDMRQRMIMHPIKPEMDGKDYTDFKDPKGKRLFVEFVKKVKEEGAGFVDYDWPKPGSTEPVPKVSFVKGFEPWGWIIGSGIYVDDVTAVFEKNALRTLGDILVAALLISLFMTLSARHLVNRIGKVVSGVNQLAKGDLTVKIEIDGHDELAELAQAARHMQEQLHALAAQVRIKAAAVNGGAQNIADAVDQQAASSNQMSASISEITSTMEELSASSTQIAEHSRSVVAIADHTLENSKKGVEAMRRVLNKMDDIRTENQDNLKEIVDLASKSKQISKVMEIINSVADQTKLIAFNAALEASSAGESGRRFSVVAAEIRRLADNVTESTGEIETKINEIQDSITRLMITSEKGSVGIADGMSATAATAGMLEELLGAAGQTSSAAQQISLSTQQQKTASTQVVMALREIATATSHTAQSVNRISQISHEMTAMSSDLSNDVGQFKLAENV